MVDWFKFDNACEILKNQLGYDQKRMKRYREAVNDLCNAENEVSMKAELNDCKIDTTEMMAYLRQKMASEEPPSTGNGGYLYGMQES